MANTKSALKRVRQTRVRTQRNRVIKSNIRASRKKVNAAILSGDADAALEALKAFTSAADKASRNNIIHRNAADRLKGALTRRIQALAK
ncbi:MAG: 30S ribosomal protein S20 [Verrucomicrobiales bacterium]|nr:30S ribosomal protein S20 [Verrucomicrobiae bacterium]MCC6881369.1 30S ribosomal protein S20 [Verrucomicrobiales bacterium]MCP5553447.1 30S ribosomal protein S20 [Akkermansiaceae bacterium]HRX53359.1 30S ribosomal protein S20 [Verrucomicrobiales bacterium]